MPAPFYAFARALDPLSGDLRFNAATQAFVEGQPLAEVVLRVLRTPRGQCLADPGFGLDYATLDKASANLAARFDAAVRDALRFLTTPGLITDLALTVSADRSQLGFTLAFVDPRDSARTVIKDQVLL